MRSWVTADRRWPDGTLVYQISDVFSETNVNSVLLAMADISARTCIKFRQKTEADTAFVQINGNVGPGCIAQVGYFPGQQRIMNLDIGCKVLF